MECPEAKCLLTPGSGHCTVFIHETLCFFLRGYGIYNCFLTFDYVFFIFSFIRSGICRNPSKNINFSVLIIPGSGHCSVVRSTNWLCCLFMVVFLQHLTNHYSGTPNNRRTMSQTIPQNFPNMSQRRGMRRLCVGVYKYRIGSSI